MIVVHIIYVILKNIVTFKSAKECTKDNYLNVIYELFDIFCTFRWMWIVIVYKWIIWLFLNPHKVSTISNHFY